MKEQIIALAKQRGKEVGTKALKDLGYLTIDILDLVVKESKTPIDDVMFAAVKDVLKAKVEEINL